MALTPRKDGDFLFMKQTWSDKELETLQRLVADRLSNAEIAEAMGRSYDSVAPKATRIRKGRPAAPAAATMQTEAGTDSFEGDTWNLTRRSPVRITTLAQLLELCAVDSDLWVVERWSCNAWEMGAKLGEGKDAHLVTQTLYRVSATLKRNRAMVESKRRLTELIEEAAEFMPSYPPIERPQPDPHLAIIQLPDVHLGKLAWGAETDGEDFDLKIAVDAVRETVAGLLCRIEAYSPEQIAVVIGGDYLNSDNLAGTTTAGTPQSNDGRLKKVYAAGRKLLVEIVDACLAVAPVRLVMVPGNHDALSIFTLGDALECWYRNASEVEVDNTPPTRKYLTYGSNLFLFVHGDKLKPEKAVAVMAAERPDLWGLCKYREVHSGHTHQSKLQEIHGTYVRTCPSLSASCEWSHSAGLTGNRRTSEGYVYHKEGGLVAQFVHAVGSYAPKNQAPRNPGRSFLDCGRLVVDYDGPVRPTATSHS